MVLLRRLERGFWIAGVLLAGSCAVTSLEAHSFLGQAAHGEFRGAGTVATSVAPDSDRPMGRIEVPALSLSAPITGDVDAASLRMGVGHIRGTALPGGLGTVGIAGHRDTFFRPLRHVQPGMRVDLTDATGTYHYLIDSTEIVDPTEVRVLDITDRPALTLITCFPFDYIGAAPRRFIVHAHLLSLLPDRSASGGR